MLKMSDLSCNYNKVLDKIITEVFDDQAVMVVGGDLELAQAFSRLPFDHLLFSGSSKTGKKVMAAASQNLTLVTLELGGKSPAIIGKSASWPRSIERLIMAKLFNAGQTCIAPDYAFLPEDSVDEFVKLSQSIVNKHYANLKSNQDYSHIINVDHYQRLQNYLEDAGKKGATIIALADSDQGKCKLGPHLVELFPNSRVNSRHLIAPC